jgi:hypothetical protein
MSASLQGRHDFSRSGHRHLDRMAGTLLEGSRHLRDRGNAKRPLLGLNIEDAPAKIANRLSSVARRTPMIDDDEKPIRYHLSDDFELEPGERVFLEEIEPGTMNWVHRSEVSDDAKTPTALQTLLREIALREGGEAWRAVTDRGELLRVFSVYDFAEQLSGKKVITLHPDDQY